MKLLLLFILILPSCSIFKRDKTVTQPRIIKTQYISKRVRSLTCIKDLIRFDVQPLEAGKICLEVFK